MNVEQRHVRKPGEPDEYEEWVVWGYFNTPAGAVNSAVGARVRSLEGEYPHTALEPLLGELRAIQENVDELLGDLRA